MIDLFIFHDKTLNQFWYILVQFIFLSVNFQVAWGETHIDQIYVLFNWTMSYRIDKNVGKFCRI